MIARKLPPDTVTLVSNYPHSFFGRTPISSLHLFDVQFHQLTGIDGSPSNCVTEPVDYKVH